MAIKRRRKQKTAKQTLGSSVKRYCSLDVCLVLIGLSFVGLTSCEREQRNVYKTKADCLQDWGSEQECEMVGQGNSYYGGSYHPHGYYYGPRYYGEGGTRSGATSVRAVSVARGGFGSSLGFHGGGG